MHACMRACVHACMRACVYASCVYACVDNGVPALARILPCRRQMYLSIYPSIYLSIHPSIHPSIHLSIYLSIYLSYHVAGKDFNFCGNLGSHHLDNFGNRLLVGGRAYRHRLARVQQLSNLSCVYGYILIKSIVVCVCVCVCVCVRACARA